MYNNCKEINEELKVFDKELQCKICGKKHYRAYNVAKNIK
jgi:transposase